MEIVLLALALVAGIVLIPFGLPGTWLMLLAGLVYNWLAPTAPFGWITIVSVAALAIVGEVIELWLSARYTRQYGGSRRAGWGAVLGGIVGAIVGLPVPLFGSILGAFWGGLIIGIVQQISALFLPIELQSAAIFVVFVATLFFKPDGIFGSKVDRV